MKATIDFDERLYRRLKMEAAGRGRTIRDLVDEGIRRLLDLPASDVPGGAAEPEPRFGRPGRARVALPDLLASLPPLDADEAAAFAADLEAARREVTAPGTDAWES